MENDLITVLKRVPFNLREAQYVADKFSDKQIRELISSEGWSPWYNENYWVNKKVVEDEETQNHTKYGMSPRNAFLFEILDLGPVENKLGLPSFDLKQHIGSELN